jgi:hypothetical protein
VLLVVTGIDWNGIRSLNFAVVLAERREGMENVVGREE